MAEESLRGRIEYELRFMNGQLGELRDTAAELRGTLLWDLGPHLRGIRNALDAIAIALRKPPTRLQRLWFWLFRRRIVIRLVMLWFRLFPSPIVHTSEQRRAAACREALAEFEGRGESKDSSMASRWRAAWD